VARVSATGTATWPSLPAVPRNETFITGDSFTIPAFNANQWSPNNHVGRGIQQGVFESLFYLNYQTGRMEPWLATGFSANKTFTVYTISLRRGVTWSDGVPFTARDVAFTLNLVRTHSILNPALSQELKSVQATNDETAVITLVKPDARFMLDNFAVAIYGATYIMPEHIWRGKNPVTFTYYDLSKGWPIGTGPYKVVSTSSTRVVLDRDDHWWAARTHFHALPAPRRYIYLDSGAEDTTIAQLEANQLDATVNTSPTGYATAHARNPKVIAWRAASPYAWIDPCPNYFMFNTAVAPWNDPAMRRAVMDTVDRVKFANITNAGAGEPAQFPFPAYPALQKYLAPNKDLLDKYVGTTGYNPAEEARILRSKGYKKGANGMWVDRRGKPLTLQLTMLTPAAGGAVWGTATQIFTQDFQDGGITVKQQQLSLAAWNDAEQLGHFQAGWHAFCGSVVDPYGMLSWYTPPKLVPIGQRASSDYERWYNARYTAIVNKIGALPPGDPRIAPLFRQALQIWLQELPGFPVDQQLRFCPYNTTYWTNVPTEQNGYIHPPQWWATFHQVLLNLKPAH
jgi:peptide/nickel transport system substrate-binding protein